LIGGDFNAHESIWEPGVVSNNRGPKIANWALQSSATYIKQPGIPTQQYRHVLDLTFSNIPFAATERKRRIRTGSDHKTLLTVVPGKKNEPLKQHHFKVKDENLPVFISLIRNRASTLPNPEELSSPLELDQAAEVFSKLWKTAVETAEKPVRAPGRSAP
jgi:hypothetical protein